MAARITKYLDDGPIYYESCACENCGNLTWKIEGAEKGPDSCDRCMKAVFTVLCPVCGKLVKRKMSKLAWHEFDSEVVYRSPMWACANCGVWYNPRIKAVIGEFEVERVEKEKSD